MAEVKGFHPNINIYTNTGWKNVKQITTEDNVASLEPFTRQISFTPVINTYINSYDGKMYIYENGEMFNLFIIPGTKIVCYRMEDPVPFYYDPQDKDSTLLYCIRKINGWNGNKVENIELVCNGQKKVYPISDFLKLLAWYFVYGLPGVSINKGIITFILPTVGISSMFEQDMRCLGHTLIWSYKKRNISININGEKVSTKYFSISDPFFANYIITQILQINEHLGVYEKKIPDSVLQLDFSHLRPFFEGISSCLLGEDSWKLNYYVTFTIEECAKRFFYLALQCGYAATINTFDRILHKKLGDIKYIEYKVNINSIEDCRIAKPKEITYKGKIYGIETALNNTLLCNYFEDYSIWTTNS